MWSTRRSSESPGSTSGASSIPGAVHFPVRLIGAVLPVSASGYDAWWRRPPSLHAIADEALMATIARSHFASDGRCGAPRVHPDLREHGHYVGKRRVTRLT